MELTQYAIDSEGKLVYVGVKGKTYTVWGIGEYGLCHGVGAFFKRTSAQILINKPDYNEIQRYYDNLDEFGKLFNGE